MRCGFEARLEDDFWAVLEGKMFLVRSNPVFADTDNEDSNNDTSPKSTAFSKAVGGGKRNLGIKQIASQRSTRSSLSSCLQLKVHYLPTVVD